MRRRSSEWQWQLGMLPSFARLALHGVAAIGTDDEDGSESFDESTMNILKQIARSRAARDANPPATQKRSPPETPKVQSLEPKDPGQSSKLLDVISNATDGSQLINILQSNLLNPRYVAASCARLWQLLGASSWFGDGRDANGKSWRSAMALFGMAVPAQEKPPPYNFQTPIFPTGWGEFTYELTWRQLFRLLCFVFAEPSEATEENCNLPEILVDTRLELKVNLDKRRMSLWNALHMHVVKQWSPDVLSDATLDVEEKVRKQRVLDRKHLTRSIPLLKQWITDPNASPRFLVEILDNVEAFLYNTVANRNLTKSDHASRPFRADLVALATLLILRGADSNQMNQFKEADDNLRDGLRKINKALAQLTESGASSLESTDAFVDATKSALDQGARVHGNDWSIVIALVGQRSGSRDFDELLARIFNHSLSVPTSFCIEVVDMLNTKGKRMGFEALAAFWDMMWRGVKHGLVTPAWFAARIAAVSTTPRTHAIWPGWAAQVLEWQKEAHQLGLDKIDWQTAV